MDSGAAGAALTFGMCRNPHILQVFAASYERSEEEGVLVFEQRTRKVTLSLPSSAPAIPIRAMTEGN